MADTGSPLLASYARFVVRRRWLVLGAVALATVALGWATTRLRVEVDPDELLPQHHPFVEALNEMHRVFGDKNLVVIGLFPHDGRVFTPAFLAKLAEVTERIRRVPGANPALVDSLASAHVKNVRGAGDVVTVERIMTVPPTDQAGADAVRERAFATDLFVGTLVTADGGAAAVHATFELTPATPGYRNLHAAVLEALAATDDGTFTYRLAGPVVLVSQLSEYADRMVYFFPLALVVIGLVHYHAFRTLQALFLPLLTALLSVLWALGLMGLVGVTLDPFNMTTPILILVVAAGHAVQVLKRFYEEYDGAGDVHAAVVRSLAHVGPVMLAAGTVAALSFCSLVTFQTASIRTFGLFTAFGIVSALIIELTVIPAMRACLPAPRSRERAREAAAHPLLDGFLLLAARGARGRRPWRVFAGAVIVLAACAVGSRWLVVDTSLKRQFSPRDPVRVDDAALNTHFAGTNTLVALVEGGEDGALEEPAVLRAIDDLQRRLGAWPGVGKATSYVDVLKRLHAAMTADDPAAGALPATRDVVAQYLFLYSLSGGDDSLDTILDPAHRRAKVYFLVHEDSTRYAEAFIAQAREIVRETFPPGYTVRYSGTLASNAAATEVMVEGKLQNIVQIAVITFAIAGLLLRSLIGGLLVAAPLALAVAVNFGVMGALGVPLDAMTAAISAMAVGIGADYALYFLFRTREELGHGDGLAPALRRALLTSGKAILFVSSAIAIGYATLCLSGFAFHVHLGALVALAMVVSSVSTLVLLPAIVGCFRPAFLWPPTARGAAARAAAALEPGEALAA
jgi:predicted RND superfamily exporter protein